MRIDVVTLFPEWVDQLERFGVVGRGMREGRLALHTWNPRDYAARADGRVDDRSYGGGPGMVMQVEPLRRALAAIQSERPARAPTILLSPQGERFDQRWAQRLAESDGFALVCGRYEGVDQRLIDADIDVELSVGDVVLSGGELPAMMVIDAVARLLDGVLGDARSARQDSFAAGVLDHPHYTRPETIDGADVPAVLLSGDHAAIERWREKRALGMTWLQRPDLFEQLDLDARQIALWREFVAERGDSSGDPPKK